MTIYYRISNKIINNKKRNYEILVLHSLQYFTNISLCLLHIIFLSSYFTIICLLSCFDLHNGHILFPHVIHLYISLLYILLLFFILHISHIIFDIYIFVYY